MDILMITFCLMICSFGGTSSAATITWIKEVGGFVDGHKINQFGDVDTADLCKQRCLEASGCRSVDYHERSEWDACDLNDITKKQAIETNDFHYNHPIRDFYEYQVSCPPGEEPHPSGEAKCSTCEIGFYSNNHGPDECFPCPNALTTARRGSTNSEACAAFSWKLYTGKRTLGDKLDKLGGIANVELCKDRCLKNRDCRSIDYYERGWEDPKGGNACDLNGFNKQEAAQRGEFQSKPEVDFYELRVSCDRGQEPHSSGEVRCVLCNYDYYSDVFGQDKCSKCPSGSKTLMKGSTNVGNCIGGSTETTKTPTETTQVPTITTEVPTTTIEIPTETTDVPTKSTEVPTETTEIPTTTIEIPTETTGVPTKTTTEQNPGLKKWESITILCVILISTIVITALVIYFIIKKKYKPTKGPKEENCPPCQPCIPMESIINGSTQSARGDGVEDPSSDPAYEEIYDEINEAEMQQQIEGYTAIEEDYGKRKQPVYLDILPGNVPSVEGNLTNKQDGYEVPNPKSGTICHAQHGGEYEAKHQSGYEMPSTNSPSGYEMPSNNSQSGYKIPSNNGQSGYEISSTNCQSRYEIPSINSQSGYEVPLTHIESNDKTTSDTNKLSSYEVLMRGSHVDENDLHSPSKQSEYEKLEETHFANHRFNTSEELGYVYLNKGYAA